MGEPVKIVIVAETDQAVAALRDFINGTNAGLKQVSIGAKAAGEGVAGMSYYFRSGMDGIRFALAGGGTRAAFYTLDEAMRGLAASGTLSFGKIKAALAGISPVAYGGIAAVSALTAAGIYLWEEYTSSIHDSEKAAKALEEQMKGVAKIFDQLRNYQKAGLLSPEAIQKYLDILSGKTPLYKSINNPGQLTTNPTETVQVQQSAVVAMVPQSSTLVEQQMQLLKASAEEVQKYIQDDIAVQGKLTDSMVEAAAKHKELLEKIHTESLSASDQEKAKIHEKYQAERDEIDATAANMGSLRTPKGAADDAAAKELTVQKELAEQRAIDFKQREEDEKKAAAAFAEGQKMFAQQVDEEDKRLDAELTLSAAEQGKTREQIYEQEYQAWVKQKTGQLYAGEITGKQYDDFIQAALTKRLEGINAESKAMQKLNEEYLKRLKMLQDRATQENPFLTDQQKFDQLGYQDKKTKGVDPSSLSENFLQETVKIQNQWGTMAQQMSKTFGSLINTAIDSVAQNFTKLIMGAESWKKALLNIESVLLSDLISAIIRMFEQWIVGMVLQATVGKALAAAGLGFNVAIAAAQSAVWATPATLATIASYGAAASAAPGLISLAEGLTLATIAGREMGGPVEAGRAYVVGEKRAELFVPESDGYILPSVPRYFASVTGSSSSSANSTNLKQSIHFWDDPRRMEKHIRDNPDIHHTIIDVMKRAAHQIRPPG